MSKKKKDILESALKLMSEKGLHIPISEIAKEARVGIGTIYRYYENKEEIILSLIEKIRLKEFKLIKDVASSDLPPEEKFTSLWEKSTKMYLDNPLEGKFQMYCLARPNSWNELEKIDGLKFLEERYNDMVEIGYFKNLPFKLVLAFITGVRREILYFSYYTEKEIDQEFLRNSSKLLLKGMRT